jgi:hypothetical protein
MTPLLDPADSVMQKWEHSMLDNDAAMGMAVEITPFGHCLSIAVIALSAISEVAVCLIQVTVHDF